MQPMNYSSFFGMEFQIFPVFRPNWVYTGPNALQIPAITKRHNISGTNRSIQLSPKKTVLRFPCPENAPVIGHRSSVIRQYYRFNGLTIQRFNKLQINLFNFSTIQQFNFSTEIIGSTIVRFNGLTKKHFLRSLFPVFRKRDSSSLRFPRNDKGDSSSLRFPRNDIRLSFRTFCHSERM